MAVSWTRRALSLGAPVACAVALAAAVSGRGCADEAAPKEATLLFLDAAKRFDRDAMYGLLGPRTRAALTEAAQRATDLSSRRYRPADMLGIDSELEILHIEDATEQVRVVSSSRDRAEVEILDRHGGRHRIELVREGDQWRLELVRASVPADVTPQ